MLDQLKDQVVGALGTQVSQMVSQRFGVAQPKADQVLPQVTPPVLASLKESLRNPQDNIGLLTTLAGQFLNDREAAPTSGMGDVVQNLLGSRFGGLAGTLAQTLGVEPAKAQQILTAVVPMVLNFIGTKAHRAEGNDLEALGRMLGVEGGLGGALGGLLGGSGAGSLAKGLGGLFGK